MTHKRPVGVPPAVVTRYQKRISGPLLDRIDIHIEVPRVDYEKLSGDRLGETSESIRQRVQAARDIQNKRFSNAGSKDIVCNADMRVGEIHQFCKLQDEASEPDAGGDESNEFVSARVIASLNWRARLLIWQEAKRFSPRIWRRHCTLRAARS